MLLEIGCITWSNFKNWMLEGIWTYRGWQKKQLPKLSWRLKNTALSILDRWMHACSLARDSSAPKQASWKFSQRRGLMTESSRAYKIFLKKMLRRREYIMLFKIFIYLLEKISHAFSKGKNSFICKHFFWISVLLFFVNLSNQRISAVLVLL